MMSENERNDTTHVIMVIGYNFADSGLPVRIECGAWGFRLVKDLSVSIAEESVSDVGTVGQIDIHGGVGGILRALSA